MDERHLLELIRKALTVDRSATTFEQLSVAGSVVSLPSIPTDATYAIVTLESTDTSSIVVRTTEGKSTPSVTVGLPKTNLDSWDILGAENIKNTQLIATTLGQSATNVLNVQYYR